jgi:WD40 repeat protein
METVEFWPLGTSKPYVLQGAGAKLYFADFTNDSRWLATCSMGASARLWPLHAADGTARDLIPADECFSLAMHPSEDRVLIGTWDGKVLLLPTAEGSPGLLLGRSQGMPCPVRIDVANNRAFVGPQGPVGMSDPERRFIRTWNLATGQERDFSVAHLTGPDWRGFEDYSSFAPDGSLYVSAPGGVLRLVLPDEPDGAVASETIHEAAWTRSILSRGGQFLFVLAADAKSAFEEGFEEQVLIDLGRRESRRIITHGSRVVMAAFGPSNRVIVTGDTEGVVRVGPVSGEEPHLLLGHSGPMSSLAVSPDGQWIASATDESLRLWPTPDVSKPPFHTLLHDELLAKLDTFTNLRAVRDEASATGWSLEIGPFPGWETVPEW